MQALRALIISQNQEVQQLLPTVLRKLSPEIEFEIAHSSDQIINILNQRIPDILFLDWQIESISAALFCKNVATNSHFSNIHIVAMLPNEAAVSSIVNSGAHEFYTLAASKEMYAHVATTLQLVQRFKQLRIDNRDLVKQVHHYEKSVEQSILAMSKMVCQRLPEYEEHKEFVLNATEWIIDHWVSEEQSHIHKEHILHAAHLCWLGKMHLPDSKLHTIVTQDGRVTAPLLASIPIQAERILEDVECLESARAILRRLFENYDGTGFPDKSMHWQIPLGSRILRAVLDYEEIKRVKKLSIADSIETLNRLARRVYDPRVIALLEEFVTTVNTATDIHYRVIQLHDMSDGMKLVRDVVTNSGLKLLPAGTVLRSNVISRVMSHNSTDPIVGNIYIER